MEIRIFIVYSHICFYFFFWGNIIGPTSSFPFQDVLYFFVFPSWINTLRYICHVMLCYIMLCYVVFAFHKDRLEFVHQTTDVHWMGHFTNTIIVFVPRVFCLPTLPPLGKAWGDARHWELGCWIWVLFSLNCSEKEKYY